MARQRRNRRSAAQEAGAAFDRLPSDRRLPDRLIPLIPEQYARYRYIVTVEYVNPVTGDRQHRSQVIESEVPLTRHEVAADAESSAEQALGSGRYPLAVWGDYVVESNETTITYVARSR